ncbi:2-oxo-4-hydroxy-4-carboxy-5-ureidoimidazoline decarboxylase [Lichenicoccus sp.]|uniref:2-oxo-4-hydroxy-4-carboxy-5-ureidoimidazoline decarboxylase n=1 Tax=Lichenicoccus sp. TaxID=2781899 RepID=UPI003D0ED276
MTPQRIGLAALSGLDPQSFSARLGHVFERSAWVADHAWAARPFASVEALHAAMVQAVREAGPDAVLALLRRHPELAAPGRLTAASAAEQGGIGLTDLDSMAVVAFEDTNRRYRERFGFPFIIAVRGQRDPSAILAAMQRRLANAPDQEYETAFGEVARIARYRLDDIVAPDDDDSVAPGNPGIEAGDFLTVHVLDVARGLPAVGLALALSRDGQLLCSHVTNTDGRCDAPLLAGHALRPGIYEIGFDIEGWRAGQADAGFYDRITIRFRVTPSCGHLHIPLLLSPYGYSTYRGS